MKPILIMLVVFGLACTEVFAGGNTDLSFYKEGQLVETRAMTEQELKTFGALEVSNQIMAIIDPRNSLSITDTKNVIDQLMDNKGVGEKLKQALNNISLSLEFDISAMGHESTTLIAYAERHLEASTHFQKELSVKSKFDYDEVKVAGKKLF